MIISCVAAIPSHWRLIRWPWMILFSWRSLQFISELFDGCCHLNGWVSERMLWRRIAIWIAVISGRRKNWAKFLRRCRSFGRRDWTRVNYGIAVVRSDSCGLDKVCPRDLTFHRLKFKIKHWAIGAHALRHLLLPIFHRICHIIFRWCVCNA